ncbi:hypothetical protein M5689_018798 [Euphorbia peplus]|nr:hypothetical protein M5689_018798 [Euphorbia peplus]
MKIHPDNLHSGNFPLVGLADIEVPVMGMITLPCTFTDGVITETIDVDWVIVDIPICYNGIMGRPLIVETETVIDVAKKRIIVENGKYPIIVNGDKRFALEVHWNSRLGISPPMVIDFPLEDNRGHDTRPSEPIVDYILSSERSLKVGTDIDSNMIKSLQSVLSLHKDKFAWSSCDISVIPSEEAMHSVDIDANYPPHGQKQRTHAHDK